MSSDSDDMDEDELLQMALKEQAQRDLNYERPSSNSRKPVANYVQPPPQPPPPSSKKSPMPNGGGGGGGAPGRRVVDDDDDSEVEMLSISSGDDESTERDLRSGAAASRGRVGAGRAAGRDDDTGWDGDEPDCWKRVDEAEFFR